MKLSRLIEELKVEETWGDISCDIKSIASHSRDVTDGSLFVAIKGLQSDGHNFIEEAIKRGASAVLRDTRKREKDKVATVVVPDTRYSLAQIACRFYGNPSRKLKLIGITGTNGKTTTLYLIESILKEAGINVGAIGTINYRYKGDYFPSSHTTPESLDLQRILRDMLNRQATHVVLEISSHALDLSRLEGSQFDAAVFTNLTHDHLDYHRDMEAYFQCKKRLFSHFLTQERWGIINLDDPRSKSLLNATRAKVITYGIKNKSDIVAKEIRLNVSGISAQIVTPQGDFPVRSNLLGELNLYNILAAAGVGITQGLSPEEIKRGVEKIEGVPGRLDPVKNNNRIGVFVDYAHTSDALEKLLNTVREFTRGKVILVFGCGGDRDREKRPKMGGVAVNQSDLTIITSDNPRSEDPGKITSEILQGIRGCRVKRYDPEEIKNDFSKGYTTVEDRKKAIRLAINTASPGDLVIIAGKGHENYQIIGNRKIPFDDRVEASKALAEKEVRKFN